MHAHAASSRCKPLHRTRPAEVNPLWHPRACKLGLNQLSSLLRRPPAKRGEIQQYGKGITLGPFRTALGKARTELQPRILREVLGEQSWTGLHGLGWEETPVCPGGSRGCSAS